MTETVIATERLTNDLEIVFHNQGNRYFGDYHQVKVIVTCLIPVADNLISDYLSREDLLQVKQLFGEHVEYRRLLKQMGVSGADVGQVEQALMANFKKNAMVYMQVDNFASRFVARRLAEHKDRGRQYLGRS